MENLAFEPCLRNVLTTVVGLDPRDSAEGRKCIPQETVECVLFI